MHGNEYRTMAARPYLVPALHASELVADHEWAAVTRVATDRILGANGSGLTYDDGERFTEGRNRGWPGGRRARCVRVPPVGRVAQVAMGLRLLVLPHARRSGRHQRRAQPAGADAARGARDARHTLPGERPVVHDSSGRQALLRARVEAGYATIQIAQAHFNARPELIACHGKCMSAAVRGACPPLPLQRADRPGERCKCDRRSAHLGCGSTEAVERAAARPARAQMWHDACVAGLYRNCTDGSRPRAAPAPAATLAGSRRRARRRRDDGRRLASASLY